MHDTLSSKISTASMEVRNFEKTFRDMIETLKSGESAREAIGKLSSNMDEVRMKFMRLQDDVSNKADSEDTFALITTMSDTLRKTLSKTPQLEKLTSIIKKKADREQILELEQEIQERVVGSLPPALTYSTCLTCNRPLGGAGSGGGGGGGALGDGGVGAGAGASWKRPPSGVGGGKEVPVLNSSVKISNTKRQNDPHSSPVTVGNLIGDPRKQVATKKQNIKLQFGQGVEVGSPSERARGGGGGGVVSKYPGRLLPHL